MLKETVQHGGDKKSKSYDSTLKPTLSELGVTKDQSSNWQKLAEDPEKEFEEIINNKGIPVSSGQILTTVSPKAETTFSTCKSALLTPQPVTLPLPKVLGDRFCTALPTGRL